MLYLLGNWTALIRAASNNGHAQIQQWHVPCDSHMINLVCYVNQNRQIIYEKLFFSCKAK